ncbi:cAMP receptor protein [Caloramator mitchellensis]|uniref:cAMP receptor protein n=1 Tax=Caloramator mitchellensis TaxID=908809 RepID=A0A0R3JVX6_CALMK|nr:Crp/Fnr family transcriptional regulator [Caloramator mitchellensis]KRQ87707.1 cAMP receptor protein [Caloramator mitchellensis]
MSVLQKELLFIKMGESNNYRKLFDKELKGHYKKIIYFKGEDIIKEGYRDEYIYYLDSGKVIIIKKDKKGDEYSIGYVMQDEFFGYSSYFELPEIATYKALNGCIIYAVDAIYLRRKIDESKELRKLAAHIVMNSVRTQGNRNSMLMLNDAKEVLLNFVLENVQKFGRIEANGDVSVEFDVNMGDISKALNLTRETVSRIFSSLKRKGIIETQRKYIRIRDMNGFLKQFRE